VDQSAYQLRESPKKSQPRRKLKTILEARAIMKKDLGRLIKRSMAPVKN
jgi:hypothetical protein